MSDEDKGRLTTHVLNTVAGRSMAGLEIAPDRTLLWPTGPLPLSLGKRG